MSTPNCPLCAEAPALPEQFYETKLFRVLVARNGIVDGHAVIIPKEHNPHFYSFSPDDIDEFGYLLKKVSFWVMRLTNAPGFTMFVSDGAAEVLQMPHMQIHIIPRHTMEPDVQQIAESISLATKVLDDETIKKTVDGLKDLMKMPQPEDAGN